MTREDDSLTFNNEFLRRYTIFVFNVSYLVSTYIQVLVFGITPPIDYTGVIVIYNFIIRLITSRASQSSYKPACIEVVLNQLCIFMLTLRFFVVDRDTRRSAKSTNL